MYIDGKEYKTGPSPGWLKDNNYDSNINSDKNGCFLSIIYFIAIVIASYIIDCCESGYL